MTEGGLPISPRTTLLGPGWSWGVMNDSVVMAVVAALYEAHRALPFPPGLAGADRAGFDLVLVDADIAGCVDTWLVNGGTLDEWRYRILHWRGSQLEQILPALRPGDSPTYWARLFRMAELVAGTDPNPKESYPPEAWRPMPHSETP